MLACVHHPAQHRAGEAVDDATDKEGLDTEAGQCHTNKEWPKRRDGGREADRPARLPLRHDHGHLLERSRVADPGEHEEGKHPDEEWRELVRVGRVEVRRTQRQRGCHTNPGHKRPDCPAELIAQWPPDHADNRADERAEERIGDARRQPSESLFSKLGIVAECAVDDQRKLGG